MNYLAHFYLSFGQEPLVVGNLLGDFVRGRLEHPRSNIYPDDIKEGIKLHRHIDFFTDNHPITENCRSLLPAKFGHYKGIVMDMFFDYFLANSFDNYSPEPLPYFSKKIYKILNKNQDILPPDAKAMAVSMEKYDWLTHYQYHEGMRRSFGGMARRFEVLKGIEDASTELAENEHKYQPLFRDFFPELTVSCRKFLE